MIQRWIRFQADKGHYLYNEKKDELVKVTTVNQAEQDDWQEVDQAFKEAYDKRKAEEAEAEETEPNE